MKLQWKRGLSNLTTSLEVPSFGDVLSFWKTGLAALERKLIIQKLEIFFVLIGLEKSIKVLTKWLNRSFVFFKGLDTNYSEPSTCVEFKRIALTANNNNLKVVKPLSESFFVFCWHVLSSYIQKSETGKHLWHEWLSYHYHWQSLRTAYNIEESK